MGLELDGTDPLLLGELSSLERLAFIVKLAAENRCRIKMGDIEVEPLQEQGVAMSFLPPIEEKGDESNDGDDRWGHTNMRPPNLREKRGEASKG